MEALNTPSNWLAHTEIKHWLKHSFVPSLFILLLLLLPKPWSFNTLLSEHVIEVKLVEQITEKKAPPPIEIKPQQPTQAEIPEVTQTNEVNQPPPTTSPPVEPNVPQQQQTRTPPTTPPEQLLKATDVMKMVKNRKSLDLPTEFQARTAPAKDFYIPKQQVTDWRADIPFLDESVDKPRLQMNFYAEGIEGSIEKFFDKITVSKTFTTKYGTKIHCAWIGIIAACGWK